MKILIVDDHSIVREGIKQIVKRMQEVTLIDEVADGNDAYSKIISTTYDLVILDISMPGMTGMDLLQRLKDRDIKIPILILSFHSQEHYAIRAFNMGASGYLSKDGAHEELEIAIRKIMKGGKYISDELAERLLFHDKELDGSLPHEALSEREFLVMIMLAKGKSLVEIGRELFISDKTVSTYRTRIIEKMGMKNNTELTIYALKNNLIE